MQQNLLILWRHRLLVQSLVNRELKARYRGSMLGFLWSFLNPLMLMGVYSLVFKVYMRVEGIDNYAIFVFCGLLPWLWFSSSILEGTNSIIAGAPLVKKVLFPAEILPITVVLSNLVHFLLGLPILLLFLLCSSLAFPAAHIVAMIPVVFVQLVFTIGLVLLLSALSVHYRDISQILANIMTLWFFLSPIIYSMDQVRQMLAHRYSAPVELAILSTYHLNPMAHIIEAYQDVLYRNVWPSWTALGVVFAASLLLLAFGYRVFNNSKSWFAEEV